MLVKNNNDVGLKEEFFGFGVVEIKAGQTKEIPDAVAALWMNPKRQDTLVTPVATRTVVVEDPVPTPDVVSDDTTGDIIE